VQEPRLLPVAKLNGQEFLVDVENRQFRNLKNSDEVIGMHSQLGRKMLKDMQEGEWSCHGISTATTDEAEV
jgi:hypothetical protein